MSLSNFSNDLTVVTINGRQIALLKIVLHLLPAKRT